VAISTFVLFATSTCVWLPIEAHQVMSNTTNVMQCAAGSFAQIVTSRLVSQLQSSCNRSANMLKNNVVGHQP
jgi:hypothetical protein